MKVVIPMAGRGSRFADHGFATPKPLIAVGGRPMLYWALRSLDGIDRSEIIVVALQDHERRWGVTNVVRELVSPAVRVVLLPDVTEGQLSTVLAARDHLNTDEDVLVASSDTYIVSELGGTIKRRDPACRGIISVADM